MQKLLISLCCMVALPLVGCSSDEKRPSENAPQSSFLENIPIVYRMDVQQGNIITQEMVDNLEPGMSKRQVRFHLGTPMLVDAFHQNRWDYAYENTEGWGETERKRLTLIFENDRLMTLKGDIRPRPESEIPESQPDTVVSVPDYQDPDRGIITKAVESVSSVWSDDKPKTVAPNAEEEAALKAAEKAKQEAETAETN